jgi:hypothetical protein
MVLVVIKWSDKGHHGATRVPKRYMCLHLPATTQRARVAESQKSRSSDLQLFVVCLFVMTLLERSS